MVAACETPGASCLRTCAPRRPRRVPLHNAKLRAPSPQQNASLRAAAQPQLAGEAALLDKVYSTHLYGGATLPDSVDDGSNDGGAGALFLSPKYADLLFRTEACLRADPAGCIAEGDTLHAVTHSGVDAMVRRLVEEAELLARDSAADITPDAASNPR